MAYQHNISKTRKIQSIRASTSSAQMNPKHSKSATYNMNQLIIQKYIDILFIQEPYLYQNQIVGITRQHNVYSSGNGIKRAAVIVSNKQLDAIQIHQLSEEDIVVIEFTYGELKFIAASIYLDINNDINKDLYKLQAIVHHANRMGLILAMDSNARSHTWHDKLTNNRGKKVEEFIISKNLQILNNNATVTTFESSTGSSNVDLTITNTKLTKIINNWTCTNEESCSDHKLITYTIPLSKYNNNIIYNYFGTRYITNANKYNDFRNNLQEDIKRIFEITNYGNESNHEQEEGLDKRLEEMILEKNEMESIVDKFEKALIIACNRSFRTRKATSK